MNTSRSRTLHPEGPLPSAHGLRSRLMRTSASFAHKLRILDINRAPRYHQQSQRDETVVPVVVHADNNIRSRHEYEAK
jgi:hypothetical protein